MAGKTILIAGGGLGGLTAAHHLRGLVSSEHQILVIEKSEVFSLGVSNLGLMTGERGSIGQVQRRMADLKRPGIEWVHAEILSVDAATRTVTTTAGVFVGDYLVLALGAELNPDSIPGFSEAAHNLYSANGAAAINAELEDFDGGRIAVLVAGAPFRCPAAPYEAAMLVEAWVREKGLRDKVEVAFFTPESIPMAVAGPDVGQALCSFMDERGISYHFEHQVQEIDAEGKKLKFEQGEVSFDMLIGIPPHRPPSALRGSDVLDGAGYIPVHPQTLEILSDLDLLETKFPGVYAIGDVTAIRLLNFMLLPKAGVFAEAHASVVAAAIAAKINEEENPAGYDGKGFCYVDVGGEEAAYGAGEFYAYPAPRMIFEPPSAGAKKAKEEFEVLLETWFSD